MLSPVAIWIVPEDPPILSPLIILIDPDTTDDDCTRISGVVNDKDPPTADDVDPPDINSPFLTCSPSLPIATSDEVAPPDIETAMLDILDPDDSRSGDANIVIPPFSISEPPSTDETSLGPV